MAFPQKETMNEEIMLRTAGRMQDAADRASGASDRMEAAAIRMAHMLEEGYGGNGFRLLEVLEALKFGLEASEGTTAHPESALRAARTALLERNGLDRDADKKAAMEINSVLSLKGSSPFLGHGLSDILSYISDQSKQFRECAGHHGARNRGAEAVAIRAAEILDRVAVDIHAVVDRAPG